MLVVILISLCLRRLVYLLRLERAEDAYSQLRQELQLEKEDSSLSIQKMQVEENMSDSMEKRRGIDFASLVENNKDIYAWITIPGMKVDYPILQNEEDNYYLRRCIDGKTGYPGCIYTNSCNAKDFSAWNTVIYGHNMANGTMFGELEISEIWEEQTKYVNIVTPFQEFQYQVYAAVEFPDVYIPNAYDENSQADRQKFLMDIEECAGKNGYLREDMEVSAEDKLITLSTCIKHKDDKRLLIVGVLQVQEE